MRRGLGEHEFPRPNARGTLLDPSHRVPRLGDQNESEDRLRIGDACGENEVTGEAPQPSRIQPHDQCPNGGDDSKGGERIRSRVRRCERDRWPHDEDDHRESCGLPVEEPLRDLEDECGCHQHDDDRGQAEGELTDAQQVSDPPGEEVIQR